MDFPLAIVERGKGAFQRRQQAEFAFAAQH